MICNGLAILLRFEAQRQKPESLGFPSPLKEILGGLFADVDWVQELSSNTCPGELEFPLSEFWVNATTFLVRVSGGRLAEPSPASARGSFCRYRGLRQPRSPGNRLARKKQTLATNDHTQQPDEYRNLVAGKSRQPRRRENPSLCCP